MVTVLGRQLRSPFTPKVEAQHGIVAGTGFKYGKRITPTFKKQMGYYLSDPHVRGAIDYLAETSVGLGYWISGKDKDAVQACVDFSDDVDLDTKNLEVARELWLCGNTLMEMMEPPKLENLVRLPISSIVKLYATWQGQIDQKAEDGDHREHKGDTLDKFLWYKWNSLDAKLRGVGLLETLTTSGVGYTWVDANGKAHTDYRPPYLEIKEELEDSMRKIIHRYVPRHLYEFRGYNDDDATAHAATIKALRPEDDIIVGAPNIEKGQEVRVTRITTDPRSRLHPFIEHFDDAVITGLENPVLKLFLEAGFTEASARTAVGELMKKVAAFRRILRRQHEKWLFKRVLMQGEYGVTLNKKQIREANVKIRWEQDIDLDHVIEAGEKGFLKREEVRRVFEKKGVELLPEGVYIKPTQPRALRNLELTLK